MPSAGEMIILSILASTTVYVERLELESEIRILLVLAFFLFLVISVGGGAGGWEFSSTV